MPRLARLRAWIAAEPGPVVTAVHGVLLRPSESMCCPRPPAGSCQTAGMAPRAPRPRPRLRLAVLPLLLRAAREDDRPRRPPAQRRARIPVDRDPPGRRPRARAASSPAGTTTGARQWRVDLVPSYKAHRVADEATARAGVAEAEPESLGPQAVAIADLLEALGIARLGVDGFEADDVIGSVAAQVDRPVVVVTGRPRPRPAGRRRARRCCSPSTAAWRSGRCSTPPACEERFGVAARVATSTSPSCAATRPTGCPGVPGHRREDRGGPRLRVRLARRHPRGRRRRRRAATDDAPAGGRAAGARGRPRPGTTRWRGSSRDLPAARGRRRAAARARGRRSAWRR